MRKLLIQGLDGEGPGDIVGAITGEAEIPGELIGNIELHDNYATVEIDSNVSDLVIEKMNNDTIGSDRVSVRYLRDDDPERLQQVASYAHDRMDDIHTEYDAITDRLQDEQYRFEDLAVERPGDQVVRLTATTLIDGRLGRGDRVNIMDGDGHRGRVIEHGRRSVVVELDHDPGQLPDTTDMEQVPDADRFARMRDAIKRMDRVSGEIEDIRDAIVGLEDIDVPEPAAVEDWTDPDLNEDQQQAVREAVASDSLYLVHTPPGTGGNRMLAAVCVQAVRDDEAILATAAVPEEATELAAILRDRGLDVVCMEHPASVPDELEEATLDRRVQETGAHERAQQLLEEAAELEDERDGLGVDGSTIDAPRSRVEEAAARGETIGDHDSETVAEVGEFIGLQDEIHDLRARANRFQQRARESVLRQADVVCGSVIHAGAPVMDDIAFDTVIVDGAARVMEQEALVALQHGDHAVLTGDHQLVPPQPTSTGETGERLSRSLFGRLIEDEDAGYRGLTRQYQMHPDIMAYPDAVSYDGELEADGSVEDRTLAAVYEDIGDLEGVLDPEDPFVIDDVSGGVDAVVERVEDHIASLTGAGVPREEVCVLAMDHPTLVELDAVVDEGISLAVAGEVHRTHEVVVLALPDPEVVPDERWLNAAVTGSRSKFVLVGDAEGIGERFPALRDRPG